MQFQSSTEGGPHGNPQTQARQHTAGLVPSTPHPRPVQRLTSQGTLTGRESAV